MGVITKQKTWIDNENVYYTDLNADFDTIYNEFNGNIDNANVKTAAGIVESKITFSATGHSHTGGTDGKLIAKNRAYGFYLSGTPSVADDLSWNPRVYATQTAVAISIHAKTAPTGASFIARVYNITQNKAVASVTLTATNTDATSSTITNASLAAGDILRVDVTQVGSTVAGSDITVILDVTE